MRAGHLLARPALRRERSQCARHRHRHDQGGYAAAGAAVRGRRHLYRRPRRAGAVAPDPGPGHVLCRAQRLIGVRVNYRLAPSATWPAGATDVAAALSWIHGNIDLFNGDAREIVAVGYGAGAFHVATLLAHPELQTDRADVAAVVLISGVYRAGKDASDSEKAYLGSDASQYNKRSVFPGILNVDVPIVLAWAADDSAGITAQGETLKKTLCGAGHCPRSALLRSRDGIASAFGLDGSGDSLAEPTLLLVHQLEARGLP